MITCPLWFLRAAAFTRVGLCGVTLLVGLASVGTAEEFAYRQGAVVGTQLTGVKDGWRGEGQGRFRIQLQPAQGEIWDMGAVSLLGLEFRNLGQTDLLLDLRLNNADATDWSHSALGRTVVRAGETMPLVVGLPRAGVRGESHPAYLKMSGWPDGRYRHWHNIDPSRVVSLDIRGEATGRHRFELGRLQTARALEPELMERLPFIDRYGQYMHRDWPGKVKTDEDLRRAVAEEAAWAVKLGEVPERGTYGGWTSGPQREATGRFRVEKVDGRWWFVDPEGYLFWSNGVTGVGFGSLGATPLARDERVFAELPAKDDPVWGEFYDALVQGTKRTPLYAFGVANLRRKYGADWRELATRQEAARARYAGVNTLAAWSEQEIMRTASVPYTVTLHFGGALATYGLPDPFDDRSRQALRAALRAYPVAFRDDPYCLGVFVNNELHWSKHARGLVTSVLRYTVAETEVKKVVRDWLKEKYGTIEALNAAWSVALTDWAELMRGVKNVDLERMAEEDASPLALLIADRYYALVAEELDDYAPGVLDLGSRLHTNSAEVIEAASRHVDVVSANLYAYDPGVAAHAKHGRPVLVSEYHFGNLTGANLGPGLRSAQDATQQARLFRRYLEQAVTDPAVVGAHWFQWRDQSVGGRPDGENYDVGFFDVADKPKRELIEASAEFSREMYRLRR